MHTQRQKFNWKDQKKRTCSKVRLFLFQFGGPSICGVFISVIWKIAIRLIKRWTHSKTKKCIKMIIKNSTCPKVGLFLFQFGGASFCGFAAAKKFGNKQICLHTSPHFPQYRRSQQHQNRLSLKKYKRSGECSRYEKVGYSSNINWSLGTVWPLARANILEDRGVQGQWSGYSEQESTFQL